MRYFCYLYVLISLLFLNFLLPEWLLELAHSPLSLYIFLYFFTVVHCLKGSSQLQKVQSSFDRVDLLIYNETVVSFCLYHLLRFWIFYTFLSVTLWYLTSSI